MKAINRRSFIKNSTVAIAGIAYAKQNFAFEKAAYHLSFSTLGCPKWTFPEILNFATQHGYEAIEIRGILGEMDLTKCPEFSPEKIDATKRMIAEKQLRVVDLGSSAELHHPEEEKRKANMDAAKKFIDLAEKLNCPFIRVFPNNLPKDQDRQTILDLITKNLADLAEYAKGSSVTVLVESHGDLIKSDDLLNVMQNVNHPHAGMIWDICNMWTITKEPPALVYDKLKKYIKHTHVKDVKLINGEVHYVLFGEGEAPIAEALQSLQHGGYNGFYSFEWEKLWHPEIQEPEIALAQFPAAIKKYLDK